MRKVVFLSLLSGLISMAGSTTLFAEEESLNVNPVELFTCKYNEGKGPADLDKHLD